MKDKGKVNKKRLTLEREIRRLKQEIRKLNEKLYEYNSLVFENQRLMAIMNGMEGF